MNERVSESSAQCWLIRPPGWRGWRHLRTGLATWPLLLTACATPVPQALNPQIVPKAFIEGGGLEPEPVWPQPDWWLKFDSPELSGLIATAQAGNRNLAAAAARVLEARAQAVIQRSALLPQADLQGEGQRSRLSGTVQTRSASAGQTGSAGTGTAGSAGAIISNSFGLTLGATYEVDLWGRVRENLRAAQETLKSTRFAQQSVALTITASVANTYFSVLALRKRIAIANEDIAAINDILRTIELRVSTGKSSHLDLAQERAQVESVEAQLAQLQEQELEARVGLAVLVGRAPETLEVSTSSPEALRLPLVSPGLPSELLLRRPDVAEAEANLASAHANLDAARSAFLPQFTLSGADGFASSALSTLFRGPSVAWDYGGSLVQTIFDGGKLSGQKMLARATQQELIASYEQAALNAYADVETALGQVRNNSLAEQHLKREVDSAREAFQISQLQYRQGTTDLLTVLQSQQTLFSAEDQLAQIILAHMQAVVHLYEALGGGWVEAPAERTQFLGSTAALTP